ncbi:mitochondrial thiamine pyrophosphate carrier-like [Malaya genurostris]|uniref:mitochondrial thiamine pyrophosphate carrier-like n=1 Tax=Malaya genurostris TaxID=325434 RepID=UPI0026F38CBF|nr:mitochondrial thiamine pyrophosphate carrier-like [Malaya genurostris]
MDLPKEVQIKYSGVSGGIAGCFTRMICQPLDVVKIRLQLQVEPIDVISRSSKYRTIPQTVVRIFAEEGVMAFWKGHVAAQMLSMMQGLTQFAFYERFNRVLRESTLFEGHDRTRNFVCGAGSGSFATLIVMPLDVIRTRFVAQDSVGIYRNTLHAFEQIRYQEGIRGLYRGLGPAILQSAPLTGGQFMFYNLFGNVTKRIKDMPSEAMLAPIELLGCGALSGICTKLLLYPLDLTKHRLQIQGFSKGRQTFGQHFVCSNMLQCMHKTACEEGVRGLYKGISPGLLKVGFSSAIFFTVYDEMLYVLNRKHNNY